VSGPEGEHPEGVPPQSTDDDGAITRDIGLDRTILSDAPPHLAAETLPSMGQDVTRELVPGRAAGGVETVVIGASDPGAGTTLPSADGARRSSPGQVRVGQVLAGKYELVRLIGQGGMGKVWKATHLGLGIPIAVKTMHPEIAATANYVRRFQREAHAASLLNHPNAVRVLDFGDDEGTLYLVMEYLAGRSLTRWLSSLHAPPPLDQVASILTMLLDAFQVAHSFGIVHRDLKPDNVFLVDGPQAGPQLGGRISVKVVDFGLAHVDDARDKGPTLTAKDVIAGTPEYMSPEQCRSLAVGPSADLYSIGCLLTEMLQLRPPFNGGSAIEVLAKQMFSHPPPLARPAGAEPVPPLLERLRQDLLSKTADKRPRDAADVKVRLIEAMSPEATLARLPTRKGDEPLGARAERAPQWDQPDGPPQTTRTRAREVGLLRLAREPGGVDDEHETGLSAHKLTTLLIDEPGDVGGDLGVLVIDAGSLIEQASAALAELRRLSPRCRVLVCAADLTTDRMNALVAAGAADVLRYPVTADNLARKLDRVLRRGR
jgi:serine/threonine protein kinase